jgi:4-amino-4-deoxy-L-arabinose transferase-like glycosyltransferase
LSATTFIPRHAIGGRAMPAGRRIRHLLRGPDTDPRWARPALLGLLALTALLYLWDLGRNGWANDFYAAAVQAGTKSWKAFFFGSFDSSSFITVDKTPASLWVMELSGRIFGFSQWSMLVPQALEGVGSVLLLYAAVRRWFGPAAGLVAGLALALTPVAALMFRFNNPDSLLVLLMVAAAYTLVRAVENGRTRWLVSCGVLLGFAFLAKMLQAFLVVPGFAVAYLVAGPPRLGKRLWQTVLMGIGIIAGAGWWVLAAELVPAADRPYFGGSTNNNILQLAIGYNGLGRITGNETGSIGGRGPGGGGFGGSTGLLRLFHSEFGGQVSWLLPAALISLAAMAWVSRRAARTDRTRAAALMWGGWVLVTGLVFSYMSGIIHPYYMVALAPGIAALVGIGATALWQSRLGLAGRLGAGAAVLVTAVWAFVLLDRTPDWLPWLRWVVVVAGVFGACALVAGPWLARLARLTRSRQARLALVLAPVGLAMVAGLAGPAAYALDTVNSTHTGSLPSAGPQAVGFGGPGAGGPGAGGPGAGGPGGAAGGRGFAGGQTGQFGGAGTGATGVPGGTGTAGGTGASGGTGAPSGAGTAGGTGVPGGTGSAGTQPGGIPAGAGSARGFGGAAGFGGADRAGGMGGPGGLSGDTQVSSALTKLLEQNASSYKWVAATEGSQEAAPLELATGDAVIAIGGFNGTDPWPTLAAFKELVAKHEVHYYVGRNSQSFGGGQGSSAIASWVAAHFKKLTVGGQTVYDLTKPLSS